MPTTLEQLIKANEEAFNSPYRDDIMGPIIQPCPLRESEEPEKIAYVLQAYFARKVETEKDVSVQPYLVQQKDTYQSIARKVAGIRPEEIKKDYPQLQPGAVIHLN